MSKNIQTPQQINSVPNYIIMGIDQNGKEHHTSVTKEQYSIYHRVGKKLLHREYVDPDDLKKFQEIESLTQKQYSKNENNNSNNSQDINIKIEGQLNNDPNLLGQNFEQNNDDNI